MKPTTSARKVLLASHHANRRGSAISLVELGTRLPQHGFEPIFVFSKSGPLIDELTAQGFAVHQVKRQGILRLGMIRQIQAILRRYGIVLVHVNSAVPFSKYIALAARLLGVPVVWHIREPVEDKRMARQRRWIRWLASRIVVLTQEQRKFLDLPSKVERVFNGVDLAHFHRQIDQIEAKRAIGYESSEFLFVQIGSIEHNKGQSRAVQALSGVLPAQPHCRLLIVGGVVDTTEVEAIEAMTGADARLKAAVRLYGETSDVRPIIWAADCLLLPSLRESFPRTLMEAMAGGVPVIASTVGAVADMVESGVTGLLVAPGEIKPLIDAMLEMTSADDARKNEMSMNCEKSAARLFSMESHVATIAGIYNKVLSPTSS
jgi:glycosyltransferase involved in cell wall biosynthesis